MLTKYKHVIWDWNGTLLDDVTLCVNIINNILSKRELKALSHNEYREIFTFPVLDYYMKAGLDLDKYPFEALGTEWMGEYEKEKSNVCLFEGAEEILSYVKQTGREQSILSAYPHITLVEIVSMLGLESYFTNISGLDHIYATSKIDIGKQLVKKIGLKGSEMVFVGDTVHDYEVACEMGADCILIANGHQSKERLITCRVPVFDSLTALRNEL
ncbi:MAG: HAD hydrolase-like protein [Ignavibacteriaceae bacterium]